MQHIITMYLGHCTKNMSVCADFAGVIVFSLAITAWKIRRINDGYFIKTELKLILFLAVTIIGMFVSLGCQYAWATQPVDQTFLKNMF